MKKLILYFWQLPQNLLGLIVIFFTFAKKKYDFWFAYSYNFGVSLGNYIILGRNYDETTLLHEKGHQKQSLYLGWFYLLIIGLPSIVFNMYDRLFHRSWGTNKRLKWYYSLPWESWADRLSNIERKYDD